MSEKKEQSLTSDEDKESIENDTLKSKDIENSDEVLGSNPNNEELSTEDINKELEAKIEDLRDQLMRSLADSENLRKRTLKEIEHSKKYSHISFVRDLVSLFDNLQRALDAVPDDKSKLSEPIKNLIVGLENPDEVLDFALPHILKMFPNFNPNWIKKHYLWKEKWAQPVVTKNYSKIIPAEKGPLKGMYLCNMAQIYPEDRGTNYAVRNGKRFVKKFF